MPRVKRGTMTHKRHKKVLRRAQGCWGARSRLFKTAKEAVALVSAMKDDLLAVAGVETVLCPPYLAIPDVARQVAGTRLGVGAQDLYWEASGAYTGEVSPAMVREFCQYVIIGHSERRELLGETDAAVNK